MWNLRWHVIDTTTSSSIHPRVQSYHHPLPLPTSKPSGVIGSLPPGILSVLHYQPFDARVVGFNTGSGPDCPPLLRSSTLISTPASATVTEGFASPSRLRSYQTSTTPPRRFFAISNILSCSLSHSPALMDPHDGNAKRLSLQE
jgi:hypothetical protein